MVVILKGLTLRKFVFDVCVYRCVLIYVCVGTGFVHRLGKGYINMYVKVLGVHLFMTEFDLR